MPYELIHFLSGLSLYLLIGGIIATYLSWRNKEYDDEIIFLFISLFWVIPAPIFLAKWALKHTMYPVFNLASKIFRRHGPPDNPTSS